MHLRSATEQLEQTAEALRRARDTDLIVHFPRMQAELRQQKEKLKEKEEDLKKREMSLAEQTRIMKAKVHAFDEGVAKSIEKSVTGGPTCSVTLLILLTSLCCSKHRGRQMAAQCQVTNFRGS